MHLCYHRGHHQGAHEHLAKRQMFYLLHQIELRKIFIVKSSSVKSAIITDTRQKSVKQVLCYEVLSETDFQADPSKDHFKPNVFVDIEGFLKKKLEIMAIYASEMAAFPFPRSAEAVEALAKVRGAACGFSAAEAFQLIKDIR